MFFNQLWITDDILSVGFVVVVVVWRTNTQKSRSVSQKGQCYFGRGNGREEATATQQTMDVLQPERLERSRAEKI